MKQWYTIKSADKEKSAEIYIYEEIGELWGEGVGAKSFIKELNALKVSKINLRINSPGGNVFDAFAIYNALVRHPARVETDIDGLAASAASYVALAGNEVRMAENASLMIHNPVGGAFGEAKDMRKLADILDEIKSSIVGVYAARLKDDATIDISQWMDEETWFTAEKAKAVGFIDAITPNLHVSNVYNLSRFKNVPESLKKAVRHVDNNIKLTRMAHRIARLKGVQV